MISEFFKTLSQVITLRSIIGYNGLVFALKKTPIVGRFIPDRLYATKELKIVYWIFHVMKELFLLFIGKIFGLGLIYLFSWILKDAYLRNGMADGLSGKALFSSFAVFLFIVYALCGILINRSVFRCTTEKEYLVFMLRMNARKLNNTLLIYDLLKLVIGYLIAGIVAIFCGGPFYVWLGIPILAVFIRLFGNGTQAFIYNLKHKRGSSLKDNYVAYVIRFTMIMFMVPILLGLIINGLLIPIPVLVIAVVVLVILGIFGYVQLKNLDPFIHKRALSENMARNEIQHYRSSDNTKSFKKIKAVGSVKSDKKGFDYLNALFVRRHRKLLITKPLVFTIIIAAGVSFIVYLLINEYADKYGTSQCLKMIGNNLINLLTFGHYEDSLMPYSGSSVGSFFRWLVTKHLLALLAAVSVTDNSFKCTQAMYINCDNSLMTFSFFKQPEKILKLFDIRVLQLQKINFGPVISYGLICNLILFITGGQDYPFHYLIDLIVPILISLIYSTMWLVLYYLFQPFTTTVKVKSTIYLIARILIGFFFTMIFWIPCHSALLALILAVFSAVYLFFMRRLVFKKAPKTWKVKT